MFHVLYRTFVFFFLVYGDPRDRHVLTHSFPTRRSSDLITSTPSSRNGSCHRPRRSRWTISTGRRMIGPCCQRLQLPHRPLRRRRLRPRQHQIVHRPDLTACRMCRRKTSNRPPRSYPTRPMAASGVTPSLASTRSEEHTSELQSLMRISYAVFCLNKK